MKTKLFCLLLCMILTFTGCSALPSDSEKGPAEHVSHLTVGHGLEIKNIDSRLVLVDDNSTLAADGLYYASWGSGNVTPYENSDGNTADLYDANLYLLLGESKDHTSAQRNIDTWMEAAKTNYKILDETETVCNGQSYTLLTYDCISENSPYTRGISAFGAFGNNAVCIELTCIENFNEDLEPILADFLNNCSYTIK